MTTHVIVTFDRLGSTITDEADMDFPSDADASQYARDRCNAGVNVTAYTTKRWRGQRVTREATACA